MNANELADVLENDYWDSRANKVMLEGAKMLRQQQVLIENLNRRIERMIEKQSHYEAMAHAGGFEAGRELGMKQERERNNEPVAWIIDVKMTDCDDNFIWNTGNYPDWQVKDWIPLYTHPVKELTDEEIEQISDDHIDWVYETGDIDFAKAILLKAQEK